MYTGFVQRGLPRSSPKNAAAPLYQPPDPTSRFLLQWATGSGKRKRDDGDDDSSDKADDEDEVDDGNSGSD